MPQTVSQVAARWSRAALLFSILVPALLFVAVARIRYIDSFREAQSRVALTARVVQEHAARVVQTNEVLARLALGTVAGLSNADIAARRAQLHQQLHATTNGLAQLQSLWRSDGVAIARVPNVSLETALKPASQLLARMQAGEDQGSLAGTSTIDGSLRQLAFRRINGLPLYVSATVDDAAVVAGWRREMALLQQTSARVLRAADAEGALRELLQAGGEVDVVLRDIVMRGALNGLDLALQLQREQPYLPVVLMTGYTAQLHKALSHGFQVLPKPCSPLALCQALADAIGRHTLHFTASAESGPQRLLQQAGVNC